MSSTPAENWRLSAASTVVTCGTAAVANIGSMVPMSWLAAPSMTESPTAVTAGGDAPDASVVVVALGAVVVVTWPATVVVDPPGPSTTCDGPASPAGVSAVPPLPNPTTITTRPRTIPAAP